MKVIFLDIDGVLNSMNYLQERQEFGDPSFTINDETTYWSAMIDAKAVKHLNKVIEKTGAKIVISSSWRIGHSLSSIRSYLKKKGFAGEIIDKTPKRVEGKPHERGHQIQAWLDKNPEVTKFVIIDDDRDMAHLMDHLVWTQNQEGMLEIHADVMIEKLQ